MRRRKLLGTAGLALVGAAAFLLWNRPSRITEENLARISQGMTREEVVSILGPPGDYRSGPTEYPPFNWTDFRPNVDSSQLGLPDVHSGSFHQIENAGVIEGTPEKWRGDSGDILIHFAPSGVSATSGVTGSVFLPTEKVSQSPLENLLWRAKRQWQKWFP
jgi:hypothetical protein